MPSDNFEPKHFLDLVKEIDDAVSKNIEIKIKSNLESAWMRSAISRAYYAVFLLLREQFRASSKYNHLIQETEKDHGEIQRVLLEKLPMSMLKYANDFRSLRVSRNNADYDPPSKFQVTKGLVKKSHGQAVRIMIDISNIMNNL